MYLDFIPGERNKGLISSTSINHFIRKNKSQLPQGWASCDNKGLPIVDRINRGSTRGYRGMLLLLAMVHKEGPTVTMVRRRAVGRMVPVAAWCEGTRLVCYGAIGCARAFFYGIARARGVRVVA
ncbi:hypothetical protein ES288_D09G076200v1 [Gossypium darwinii]|uniref:Uncharacterized protein n=2 Tax=Gossypium TaxID=3633 RepID=A0A5D2JDZ5_GOSTO|nr:hypothetical protein ES288_D09G076200v1 [Gossypium darwinii]TYH53048.1 hypothetical protein ES332_D09G070800v1 [Gossypium tomentosum]